MISQVDVAIDLETIPQQPEEEAKQSIAETISHPSSMSKQETIDAWHAGEGKYAGAKAAKIEEEYRKTSLDGTLGEVVSISFAVEDSDPMTITRTNEGVELIVLEDFAEALADRIGKSRPFFIGHNIGGFDLKFLYQRLIINQVSTSFPIPFHGRHGQHFFDTMTAWAGFRGYIKQDALCAALGIEGKPNGMDGSKVYDLWKEGLHEEVAEYNEDDVIKCREIFRRLSIIPQ